MNTKNKTQNFERGAVILLVSAIVGITNVIPFFGPFIGAIPSAFIIFISEPTKMFWFIIIGGMLLPIITFVPVGATAFLIQLFKNRIAGFIFGIIVSIWLLVTTIEFWCYLNQFDLSGGEWFMAITITLTMACDIISSFAVPFGVFEK